MSDPSASFHVAGILVQASPRAAQALAGQIGRVPGAVVHAMDGNGRLVVTLESDDSERILQQLTRLQVMPGVLSAVLVSEHSEPLAVADQEIPHDPSPQDPA